MVREAKAAVIVPESAPCTSACTLVLMAGVLRGQVAGKVGIHRPALTELLQKNDMRSVKDAADQTALMLRVYAAEMNVSERFIEDLLVVPPEEVRWLSQSELRDYGLGYVDPVHAETLVLEGARRYGVSPDEYRKRDQRASNECSMSDEEAFYPDHPLVKRSDCAESILSGQR